MASFSQKSMNQINTLEQDIQTILHEAIRYQDFSVIEGQRTAERQHEHWKKGRQLKHPGLSPKVRNNWEYIDPVNKTGVVTHKDGYERKSIHQQQPKSGAVDIVPYPEMWDSKIAFAKLREVIKGVQDKLFEEGRISRKLENGFDLWDGFDEPHWQLTPK